MKVEDLKDYISKKDFIIENKKLYDLSNFKKSQLGKQYISFTIRVMTVEMLVFLSNKNLFKQAIFHPSAPPHGGYAADSISYRYNVHVEVNTIE